MLSHDPTEDNRGEEPLNAREEIQNLFLIALPHIHYHLCGFPGAQGKVSVLVGTGRAGSKVVT